MKSQRRKWLLAVCLLAAVGIGGTYLYLKHTKAPMSSLEELNAPVNSIYYTSPEEEHIALDTETGVEYIDNELLVISLKTEEELNEALESRKGKAVGYIEDISLYQVKFEETYSRKELEALGEELTEAGIITSFMENLVTCLSTDFLPSDQRWEKEWNSGSLSETWPLEAIHMEQAWDFMDRMNDPVSVGIFDTGFFDTHEDLSFAATPLANQLEESSGKLDPHGTAVAGVIGAGLDNETGISGIIPDKVQELYGVSAWGLTITENKIDLMAVQTGLAYLISVRQCRVINVSLSLWDAGQEEDPENSELFREYTDALTCLFSGLLDSGPGYARHIYAGDGIVGHNIIGMVLNKALWFFLAYLAYILKDAKTENISAIGKIIAEVSEKNVCIMLVLPLLIGLIICLIVIHNLLHFRADELFGKRREKK